MADIRPLTHLIVVRFHFGFVHFVHCIIINSGAWEHMRLIYIIWSLSELKKITLSVRALCWFCISRVQRTNSCNFCVRRTDSVIFSALVIVFIYVSYWLLISFCCLVAYCVYVYTQYCPNNKQICNISELIK